MTLSDSLRGVTGSGERWVDTNKFIHSPSPLVSPIKF